MMKYAMEFDWPLFGREPFTMQAVDNTLPFADQVVFPSEVGDISCLMPTLTHVKIQKILPSDFQSHLLI